MGERPRGDPFPRATGPARARGRPPVVRARASLPLRRGAHRARARSTTRTASSTRCGRSREETDDVLPIFPTHDEHLNAIARHADALGERYRFPFPAWDVLEKIQSKRHQLETAEAAGVPVPRTFYPRSAEEARAAGEEVGFPLIVKPSANVGFRRSHKRQLFRCETPAELDRAYELAAPHEPMVQELIPSGPEEMYTLGSYLDRDGRGARALLGPQAQPDPRLHGQRARRRGGLGRGGRRARARAPARARLPRHLAGRDDARPARRPLQAARGQPAALAVAQPRRRVRRRPAVDRLPRPGRRPAAARADARRRQALGDHAHGRLGTRDRAAAVRRRRLRARRPEAGARAARPPRPAGRPHA